MGTLRTVRGIWCEPWGRVMGIVGELEDGKEHFWDLGDG